MSAEERGRISSTVAPPLSPVSVTPPSDSRRNASSVYVTRTRSPTSSAPRRRRRPPVDPNA